MHILFLSHYFPPEVNAPASRTYEHCRQWVADGDEVTVVTCVPNHPAGRIYPGFQNRLFQRATIAGIETIRVLTYVTPNEGLLKRTLNYVFFMLAATCASLFVRRPDVVVSTSPQFFNGLAGYLVSVLRRVPWVLEVRDLWPESILELGAIKNRQVIRVLHALALFAYRRADQIVVVTDAFKEHIVALGVSPDKIAVIKNGADLSLFDPAVRDDTLAAASSVAGKFVVSYVGTHGMAHGLESVLQAAALLRGREDIAFLLIGDGAAKRDLVAMREALGLANVIMLDQLDRRQMPAVWSATDASLVVLRDKPLFATVIPSKIFESMAMRKPIILGVVGESSQIVEQAGAGLCVKPEDPQALAEAVCKLCDDPALVSMLGQQGHDYVARNHDRVALARRFAALMRTMTAVRPTVEQPEPLGSE
jgi:glycosyltransferase involved in cell wall biosynthesis